jgi:hypothetical protein
MKNFGPFDVPSSLVSPLVPVSWMGLLLAPGAVPPDCGPADGSPAAGAGPGRGPGS